VPKVNPTKGKKTMNALSNAIAKGLARACHDLSEGGIGVAAAEMAFAGGLGITIYLEKVPLGEAINRSDFVLFSESNTRFLVEVPSNSKQQFEKTMKDVDFAAIGEVTADNKLQIYGLSGHQLISAPIDALKEAWQRPLRW
jgi:phosphoribosylformylglycinamidine synthase